MSRGAALDCKFRVLEFSAKFIVVGKRPKILLQSQTEKHIGISAKRHRGIPLLNRAQRRTTDAGALCNLSRRKLTSQSGQTQILADRRQSTLERG